MRRVTVTSIAHFELMEVGIGPTHDALNDVVKLTEMNEIRHQHASPDRGFDLHDGEAELQNGWRFRGRAHGARSIIEPF